MASFMVAPGAQGSENGYPSSATDIAENLDSDFRTAVTRQGEAKMSMQSDGMERRPELATEHLVLTQIASAAASAGTR